MATIRMSKLVMNRFFLGDVDAKAWALKNGFKPDTVYKTIKGVRGRSDKQGESARIREALRRDGYWTEDLPADAVVNI